MARPAKALPTPADDGFNPERLEEAGEAAKQLAVIQSQQEATVRAVAAQLGYQLPADCTDPDLIQRDISANMRRSVEACLEVGRGLRVLKEACEHGSFMARLDVLGIEASVARRFMETATKFAKRATSHVLGAAGSQSKLFEMLILDDEQIEELELSGQTGELKLDDIATMSVKELRAAVRETRADLEQARKRSAKLAEENADLAVRSSKKIVADTDWPDALIPLCDQLAACKREIDHAFSKLETARIAVLQVEMPEDQRPKFEAALKHVAEVYASALASAERNYLKDQVVFAQTLGAYLEMDEV
ncbi:hypothetical protein [Burkholderia cenocepacia]|jgi:hypothetical protein|uniref:hypothetical protein n=1 Tax=Burkholderia cenocepacia TaxID=95486 RepID=UPI001E47B209|nr:hypothetical protein [Burkholderia cenocepacia]